MNYKKIFYLLGLILAFNFTSCDNELPDTKGNVEEGSLSVYNMSTQGQHGPEGFQVNVLAPHAPFTDNVAAQFRLKYAEGNGRTHVKNLDPSTMIIAEVIFQEMGSTTGWHVHPGMALINMVEGELEVVGENDCTPRLYSAGDAWMDIGDLHKATAVSNGARAIVTFLGIPQGQPATIWEHSEIEIKVDPCL